MDGAATEYEIHPFRAAMSDLPEVSCPLSELDCGECGRLLCQPYPASKAEVDFLAAKFRRRGYDGANDPVLLFEGKLLDGVKRQSAAKAAGVLSQMTAVEFEPGLPWLDYTPTEKAWALMAARRMDGAGTGEFAASAAALILEGALACGYTAKRLGAGRLEKITADVWRVNADLLSRARELLSFDREFNTDFLYQVWAGDSAMDEAEEKIRLALRVAEKTADKSKAVGAENPYAALARSAARLMRSADDILRENGEFGLVE